ncbi:hypothetical protein GQ53DRAFT_754584 [Thozetella sp. PMI_491]|nr:hypothetical protein GQ53DRAFT_754584 [Thozetella sp. PMI_491]
MRGRHISDSWPTPWKCGEGGPSLASALQGPCRRRGRRFQRGEAKDRAGGTLIATSNARAWNQWARSRPLEERGVSSWGGAMLGGSLTLSSSHGAGISGVREAVVRTRIQTGPPGLGPCQWTKQVIWWRLPGTAWLEKKGAGAVLGSGDERAKFFTASSANREMLASRWGKLACKFSDWWPEERMRSLSGEQLLGSRTALTLAF